jgi:hypothetical protein
MENTTDGHGPSGPSRHMCQFPRCEKTFIRKEHLTRHERSHAPQRSFVCYVCQRGFTRKFVSHCSLYSFLLLSSTYGALLTSSFHTAAEKLSRLTVSTLAIFFGVTSFATIVLPEPLHGMDALAMDVTVVRSSVKAANPAHPVSREESNASSKGMR